MRDTVLVVEDDLRTDNLGQALFCWWAQCWPSSTTNGLRLVVAISPFTTTYTTKPLRSQESCK